jgi:hypothetical protein
VRDAPRGGKKVSLQSSRAFSARGHVLEQGRLGVATSGGPLGRWTAVVLELEQGKLPWLGSVPFLELLAAKLASLPPAIGVTANKYGLGLRHGGRLSGVRLDGSRFLQAVQEVRRALGMGCSGENRPLVVFQHLD